MIINILLLILLWILIVFLLALAAIIFIPISYRIEGKYDSQDENDMDLSVRIIWFFFLRVFYFYSSKGSSFTVKLGPFKLPDRVFANFLDKEAKEEQKKAEVFSLSGLKSLLSNLDIKSIFRLGTILIKKIFKKIKPRYLNIRGVIGFSDTCSTGQFIGLYEAVAGVAGFRNAIDLQGDFNQQIIKIDLKICGFVAISSFIGPALWFILQKPIRRAVFTRSKAT